MYIVKINTKEKILELSLISRLIKHGYDKAYQFSIGNEHELEFIQLRRNKNYDDLFAEYKEITTLLHSL